MDNPTTRSEAVEALAQRILEQDVLACQSALVDSLLSRGDLDGWTWDGVENLYREPEPEELDEEEEPEPVPQEIFEWWLVTGYLAAKLSDIGEPVLDNDYGNWWGRTCTGQSIMLDGTLQDVASRLLSNQPS